MKTKTIILFLILSLFSILFTGILPQDIYASNNVVIIDPSVNNWKYLSNNISSEYNVILLKTDIHPILQLTDIITQYYLKNQNINEIHLVCHGTSNSLLFSSGVLNPTTIETKQNLIRSWKNYLSPNAELLIYACNVTKYNTSLVQILHQYSTLNIAASNDLTGHSSFHANWNLETHIGTIQSTVPFHKSILEQYKSCLGTFDFQSGISGSGSSSLQQTTGDGTVTLTASNGSISTNAGSGEGGSSGHFALSDAGSISSFTFSFSSNVNITSLLLGEIANKSTGTFIFTDLTSGSSNSIVNVNASDSSFALGVHGQTVTLNWNNVSSFQVTYSEGNFSPFFDTVVVTVPSDSTAPRISSIVRQSPSTSPTNADSVVWRVTFDEAVSGVDTTDFTVSGTTGTVTNVANAVGNAYDVTVSGGDMASLDATVTLGVAGGQNIQDSAANALTNTTPTGTNDHTFVIDNTGPTLAEVTVVTTPTGDTTPNYTFSTNESGSLSVGGGCGTSSSTTISSTGNHTITLTQSDNSTALTGGTYSGCTVTLTDAAGNTSNTLTLTSFTIDTTAPRIGSVVRQTPSTSPTNANSVVWRVMFDEAVSGVDITDFTVSGTTGTVTNVASAGGNAYDVTVSGGDMASLDATVTLGVAGGQNIQDSATNALTNTSPTGTNDSTFVIDNTGPSYSSSTTANVAENSGEGTSVIDVTADSDSGITYSETGGTGAALFEIDSTTGQVTVSSGASLDFEGTNSYTYQVQASDAAGNTNNQTITITVTAVNEMPSISTMGPSSGNVSFTAGSPAFVRLDTDTNAAVSDPELDALNSNNGNYNGATLSLVRNGGTQSEDQFALVGDSTAFSNGDTITISSTVIGTVDTSSAGTAVITFNNAATTVLVNRLLQQLAYRNSNDSATGDKIFDIQLDDQNSSSAQGSGSNLNVTVQVTVTIGQTPVIGNLNGDSFTFTEGNSATILDQSTTATLTDGDSPTNLNGGNLTVSVVNLTSGEDVLSFSSAGGFVNLVGTSAGSNIQVDLDGGGDAYVTIGTLSNTIAAGNTLVVNFNNSATVANTAVLLSKVTYHNTNTSDPTANTRTVRFTVTDDTGLTSSAADVAVTIDAVNDDPEIASLPSDRSFTEDTAGNLDLSTVTLSDVDAGTGNITLMLNASGGTLTAVSSGGVTVSGSGSSTLTLTGTVSSLDTYLNTASQIQYTGASNAAGNDAATLTITANDGGNSGSGGGSNVNLGTVNLDITAVNDAPSIAFGDTNSLQYTAGTQLLFATQATTTDIDNTHFNGGSLIVGFSAPTAITTSDRLGISPVGTNAGEIGIHNTNVTFGGTVIGSIAGGVGSTSLTITFTSTEVTPAAAQALIRRLTFENTASTPGSELRMIGIVLDDGAGGSSISSAISRTVQMNQPPAINDDTKTIAEDSPLVFASSNLTANDTDPESDTLTVTSVSGAVNGTVSISGSTITFTPSLDYHGDASFTYTVSDGQGNQGSGTVSVTVTPVNDVPTLNEQTLTVMEGTPTSLSLTAFDRDGDPLSFELISGPANGGSISSFAANGTLTYSPPASIVNQTVTNADSFSVRVSDGTAVSSATTIHINVVNINDAPTASPVTYAIVQNAIAQIQLHGIDPDGENVTYAITSQPTHGSLFNFSLGNGVLNYQPTAGFTGNDSFSYTVTDGKFTSAAATVSITVLPVPTPKATATSTNTPTVTPTATKTNSPTHTPTPTPTVDPNATSTYTPTETHTPTVTPTPTHTSTPTPTATHTPRPGNHPPIITVGTTIPEQLIVNTPFAVQLFITDEEGDAVELSFLDSTTILDQRVFSNLGLTVMTLTIDTSTAGNLPITVYVYDGSETTSTTLIFPIVDLNTASPTPSPMPTNTATPEPTTTPTPVILQPTVTPTHTATNTTVIPTNTPLPPSPTATRTPASVPPTNTPGLVNTTGSFIEIFDNTESNENLAGGLDFDEAGVRDLVIRWTVTFPTDVLAAFHVYVRVNNTASFQYLGQSNGSANQFVWTTGSSQVTPLFRVGPQPGNTYAFLVYAIPNTGDPNDYLPITTTVPIAYRPGEPITAALQSFDFGAVIYEGAEANDRITSTTLQVRDSALSTRDITGATDFDAPANRGLTIAWNIEGIEPSGIREYHVYIRPNRQERFDFLSKTVDGLTRTLHWTPGNPGIVGRYRSGPQLGSFYEFIVYALTVSGNPAVYGPITVNGPISYTAGSVLSPELAGRNYGGVQMLSTVTVTDDLNSFTDLSGSTDSDTPGNEALVIRWNTDEFIRDGIILTPDSITDVHIYVRVNNSNLQYLGRTGNPNNTFYEWKHNNNSITTEPFTNGPQNNNQYHFAIFPVVQLSNNNPPIPLGPIFSTSYITFTP